MNATSTDGNTTCTGTTNFNVTANATASATVVLQCRGPRNTTTGTVAISGRLDNCPFITGYSASALEAFVGASINIAVTATDFDAGDTISYTWTASPAGIGTVAAPGSATTTFTCTAVGSTSLSIAVSDTICGDSLSNIIPINCLQPTSPTGGSGTGGSGVGGMGTGGAGVGGMGTGGMGTGGKGTGGMGTGGMGTGGMGTGGKGTGGAVASCIEPVSGSPAACCDCTPTNCALAPHPDGTDGCSGIADPTQRALCVTAAQCFSAPTHPGSTVSPGPCTTSGDAARCFCGTSGAACFSMAGAANGPCTAEVFGAAGTNDPATIRGLFTSSASPLGRAVNLIACQGIFCADATSCSIP